MARSPVFDGVDPRLVNLINQVSGGYKPYGVRTISGSRPGSHGYHGKNRALDVELFNRDTGAALENYQDPSQFGAYQQFANALYAAADPELQKQLRWGGYFSGGAGKYGALDLMHFDTGGLETPMGGGSWTGGLTPDQAKLWNLQTGGGVGGVGEQFGPTMPNAPQNYTPEQRRAAIASIESAGSGDYNARGPVTNRQGDQALGRYQIMASNLPAWSKAVLGREVTVDEFMKDPKIQDAIFDKTFGDYVQKYGEMGAASMWFTGRPSAPDAKDVLGTTGRGYIDKYMKALGSPLQQGDPYPAQQQSPSVGGGPAVVGAPGAPGTEAPKDRLSAGIQEMAGGLGSMFGGSGGGSAQMPISRASSPMATMIEAPAAQTFNPAAADANRQRLAIALQRLNSGKLG